MALEQATFMAKQLPTTTTSDPTHLPLIYSSLHSAHLRLSSFLSSCPPPPAADHSISSAVNGDVDDNDYENSPMQVVGDDEGDLNSNKEAAAAMEEVEGRMRDGLFIQNKRPKRQLSPSAAECHHQRSSYYEFRATTMEYDPHRAKERAFDLVLQFHG